MKLAKYRLPTGEAGVGQLLDDQLLPLNLSGGQYSTLSNILDADDPQQVVETLVDRENSLEIEQLKLLAPIDQQEVWAAGVTYRRSRTARMEESEAAASCYDRVYESPRPELFFKASPHRVVGPGGALRIRSDATWNVPEPEVTLALNRKLRIVGLTIGNDMSSRDIEGENPLYLPQAKVYDGCCGLGPCVTLIDAMPPLPSVKIAIVVLRAGERVFDGETSISEMARTFEELVGWLGRDNSFPSGAFLMTGTGIVPDSSFTLAPSDQMQISIDGIGTLINSVVQG